MPSNQEQDLLNLGALAEGGAPAQTHRQRTSSFVRLQAEQNRSAFVDEVPVADFAELKGKPGTISVDTVDTDTALHAINARLAEAELAGNYAIDLLVAGARSTPNLFSISPIDTLRPFLAQELTRIQQKLVDIIVPALSGQESSIAFSPFFESLSCIPENFSNFIADQQDYLRRICEYKKFNAEDTVRSVLYRTGGLYRTVPTDINVSIRYQEMITELSQTKQLVIDAIEDIGNLHLFVYGAITKSQTDKLLAAIKNLQARRAALEAAYEAQKNKPGMVDSLKLVADVGKNFAGAYEDIVLSNWLEAGEKFDTGMRQLGELWTADRAPPNTPDLYQLDEAIKEARAGLDAFLASVQETRREIIGSQNAHLRDLIATRDRLEQHRTMARFEFGDLIRGSIQEYLKTSDLHALESNLALIKSSFDETKVPSPLNLAHLPDLCHGNSSPTPFAELKDKAGCIVFQRSERPYAVISQSKRATGFPLLIVEPVPGGGTLTQSFEQAFVADELLRIELEEMPQ
jgi:hypothetical protein